MDFFAHQARARRNTARLVALFAVAVLVIIIAINGVVALVVPPGITSVAWVSIATGLPIVLASWWRIRQLRGGGGQIARQAGAAFVPADTADPLLRRYRNVAEEMAIAAGIPVPQLYVLDNEPGINAFAAGYSAADAAVVVTRGALERLNRDELQGVVAHEYAHVLNGDMRLNIQLMGWLYGILVVSLLGRWVLQQLPGMVSWRSRNWLPMVLLLMLAGLLAMAIGSLGVLCGRLIKAAVSREREWLADASAVQFTRQHRGLSGALKKIGALADGSQLKDRAAAEDVSHMLFGEGFAWSRWFATHPPLVQRIARLEPGFSGVQLNVLRRRWRDAAPVGLEEDRVMGLATSTPQPAATPVPVATPAQVSAQVGSPGSDDQQQARRLHAGLPSALTQAARDRGMAPALVLALVLDRRLPVARHQQQAISEVLGDTVAAMALQLWPAAQLLDDGQRLPLASLTFPALRSLPRPQLRQLQQAIDGLIHRDGQLVLFDYCLAQLMQRQVVQALDPAAHASFGRRRLGQVRQELATLLAVLAWQGHAGDEPAAQRAYLAGQAQLPSAVALPWSRPTGGVWLLDRIWDGLDALDPLAKQQVVEAVTATVLCDGRVAVAEAELLRLVCGVLHCPLPVHLEGLPG